MTRSRVALALAVVAVIAVLVTAAVAVATYLRADEAAPRPLVVTDVRTGARFEVPGEDWEVRGPRSRIYYADARARPTAVVTGPAVFRDGYCADRPGESNRAFAGFTEQPFDAWLDGLSEGRGVWTTGDARDEVVLAGGEPATLRWAALLGGQGECASSGIEVAMVQSGDVRVVLVADSGDEGTLSHDEIVEILGSLRIP